MMARGAFPQSKLSAEEHMTGAKEGLDLYFQNCSMLVNVESLARFGAMLANNGVNPVSGQKILSEETVQSVVTLTTTCGMYNGAGKFVKDWGVPSKSGVAGALMTIIPGIGGISSWSPKLNEEGNTVKGIGMIEKLG
jgi:glutaminase